MNSVPFYGASIVCLDDPNIQEVIPRITRKLITYGFSSQADIRAADVVVQPEGTSFACYMDGELAGKVSLRLHGRHNALNALAAIAVARELDIDFATIATTLAKFAGTERRMQRIGTVNDALVIDDYGHHPTEIRAVLSTVRDAWDRRTIVCFQPHRFSRSQLLMEDFGRAFYQADAVFVLPIYAAGEEPIPGVTSDALATSIIEHGHKEVHTVDNLEHATEALAEIVRPGDLILTLGAGDVWKVARDLVERLRYDGAAADPEATESNASASGNGA